MTRTATEFRRKWDVAVASNQALSFIEGYLISENATHSLRDARGTPHENIHCAHRTKTLPGRPRGLWQHALLAKAAEVWAEDSSQQENFLFEQIKNGTNLAYDFFGSSISHAREEAIKEMLIANITTGFVDRDKRFVALAATFDDTMIEWLSGRATIEINSEPPRFISVNETINFDATFVIPAEGRGEPTTGETILKISDDFTSDTDDDPLRLNIPKLYKATFTTVGTGDDPTRTEITDTADGDYTLTAADFNAAVAKTQPYSHLEIILRSE